MKRRIVHYRQGGGMGCQHASRPFSGFIEVFPEESAIKYSALYNKVGQELGSSSTG